MRKKNSGSSIGILIIFIMFIGGSIYLYNSTIFERNLPTITMEHSEYWNFKKPIEIKLSDDTGIISYRVHLKDSKGETTVINERPLVSVKEVHLKVKAPKIARSKTEKSITIIVEAIDKSRWNFFAGNSIRKEFKLIVDRVKPKLSVVVNSYKISKGGTALVIFKTSDDNLKDIYVETNFGKKFKTQPFYKEGYHIALLAWPITEKRFKATIRVSDMAGNSKSSYVPLYLKEKHYKVSNIKLSDRFLNGKIAELSEEFDETQGVDSILDQFKIINEDVRAKNEKLIHSLTSKVSDEMISDFKIKKMYPLRNASVVARFGDHRKYSYKGKYISEAYHLGLDLASNSEASIVSKNGGEVVYSDYNGLYGNMPIISHGLGLYTLYGHCSSLSVESEDIVKPNESVAYSGKSGYAMGDHLHFGVLVQGIEVRPQEWMDKDWIKQNIADIIKKAKKSIDKSRR